MHAIKCQSATLRARTRRHQFSSPIQRVCSKRFVLRVAKLARRSPEFRLRALCGSGKFSQRAPKFEKMRRRPAGARANRGNTFLTLPVCNLPRARSRSVVIGLRPFHTAPGSARVRRSRRHRIVSITLLGSRRHDTLIARGHL